MRWPLPKVAAALISLLLLSLWVPSVHAATGPARALRSEMRDGMTWVDVRQVAETLGLKTKKSKKSLLIQLPDGPVILNAGDVEIDCPTGVYPKLKAPATLIDSEIFVPLDSLPYFLDVVVNHQGQDRFSIKKSPIHLKPRPRTAKVIEEPTAIPTEKPTPKPTPNPTLRPTDKPAPEPTLEPTPEPAKRSHALGSEFRDGKTWVDVKQIAEKLGLKTKRTRKSLVIELQDGPVTLKVGDENIEAPAGVYPRLLAAPVLVDSELYVPLDSVPYFLDVVVDYQEGKDRFSIKNSPIHLKPKPRKPKATEEPTAKPTEKPTLVPTEKPTPKPTAKPTLQPTEKPTQVPTARLTEKPAVEPTLEPTRKPAKDPKALGSEFFDGRTWVDVKQIAEKLGLKTRRMPDSLVIEVPEGPLTLKVGDENVASRAGVYPKLLAPPVLVDSQIYVPLDSVPYFLDIVVSYQGGQDRFSIKKSPIHLKPRPRGARATEEPTEESTEKPTLVPTRKPTPEPTPRPTPRPTEKPTPEPTPEPTLEPTPEATKKSKTLGSEFRDGKTWVDVKQIAEKLGLKTRRTRKTLVIELADGPVTLKAGEDSVSSPNGIYPKLLAPAALVDSQIYVPLDSVPYFLDVVVSYQEGQDRFAIKKSPIHLKPRPLISLAAPIATEEPTLKPTEKATRIPTEKPTLEPTQEPTLKPTPRADLKGDKRPKSLRFESRDGKTWVDVKQIAEKLGLKTKRTRNSLVIELKEGPVTLKAGSDDVSSPIGFYPKLVAPAALVDSEIYAPLESVPYFLDVVVNYQEDQQRFAIKKSPIHLKPRPLLALATIDMTPPPTQRPTLVPTERPTAVETPEPTPRPTRMPDNRKRFDTRRLDSEKRDGQTWVKVRQVADLLKIKAEKRGRSLILFLPYCSIVLTAGSQTIECAKGAYPPLSVAPILKDSELWLPLDALPLFLDLVIRYDENGRTSILPTAPREGATALSGIPDRVPTVEPQRVAEKPAGARPGKEGAIDFEARDGRTWVRVRQVADMLKLRNHIRDRSLIIELPDCEVTLTEGSKVIDCVKGSFPDLDEAPIFKDHDLWLPLDSLPLFLDVLVKYQKDSKRFVITRNPLHLQPRSVVTVTGEGVPRAAEKEPTASVSREIVEPATKAVSEEPIEIPEKPVSGRAGKGRALKTIERDDKTWVMVRQVADMLKLKSKKSAKGRKLSVQMPDCEITLVAGSNSVICSTRAYPTLDTPPLLITGDLWLPLESMPYVFDVLVRFDEKTKRRVIRRAPVAGKFVAKEGAEAPPLKEPYWGYGLYGKNSKQVEDDQDLNPDAQFPQAVEFAGSFTDQSYWNPKTGIQDINQSTLDLVGNIGDYSVGLNALVNRYFGKDRVEGALEIGHSYASLRLGDVQRSMGRLSVPSGRRRGLRLTGSAFASTMSAYYSPASWNTDRLTAGRPEAHVMGVDLGTQAGPGQYSVYLRRTSLVDGSANSLVASAEADLGFAHGRSISGSFALSAGEQADSGSPATAYRGEMRSTQGMLTGNVYYQKIGDGFDASGQSRSQPGIESMGLGSTLALGRIFKPYYRVQRYVRHLSLRPGSSSNQGQTLGLLMSARPGLQFELSGAEQSADGVVNSQGLDLSGRLNAGRLGSGYARTGIRRLAAYPGVTNYHGEIQLDVPLGGSSSFGLSSSLGGRAGLEGNPALFDFINNGVRLNYRSWDERWGARLQVGHRMSPEGPAGSYGQSMSALLNLDIRAGLWNLRPELSIDGIRWTDGAPVPSYAGNLFVSYDFSFRGMPIKAALSGVVYEDLNHNHRRDPGEPGVRHIDIHLDGGDVAQTDDEGRFAFNGLMPEFHRLDLDWETVPPEYFRELSTNKTFDMRKERVQEWELGLER